MRWTTMIAAALTIAAATAGAAELRLAFVDVKAAIENTREYQAGIDRLKALQAKKQKELDALQKQIEELEREIERKSMVLAPEQLMEKQERAKRLRKKFERMRQDAQEELSQKKLQLDMRMMARFRKALEAIAKERGYDFVFGRPVLLYAKPVHDITAEVTKRLDAMQK